MPEQIITDNGPQFTSEEFQRFVLSNGVKHSKTAPYHPQSNGAAERFVQTFKQAMKKMKGDAGDIKKKLADFLLRYRKTPHATTNEAPAMLLMKRIPRSRIDLCQPKWRSMVEGKQEVQKRNHDKHAKGKEFKTEARVWVRDYRGDDKWSPGIVTKQTGPVSYEVDVGEQSWHRHAEQLRPADIPEQSDGGRNYEPNQDANQDTRPKRNIKVPERLTYEQLGKPI